MVTGYWKSDEGVKAYSDIGLSYPAEVLDIEYDKFKAMIANSPHNQKNKETVTSIVRILADDQKEYLTYGCNETGYDALGNEREFFRGDLGKYPKPIPRYEMRIGPDMSQEKRVVEILRHDVGYSIPAGAGAADKLHKSADEKKQQGATSYYVQRANASPIKVTNFDAFKDGDFNELEKFGMTLDQWTEQQRAITEIRSVAEKAESPEEKEKAQQALAEAGEPFATPMTGETTAERAERKEAEAEASEEVSSYVRDTAEEEDQQKRPPSRSTGKSSGKKQREY